MAKARPRSRRRAGRAGLEMYACDPRRAIAAAEVLAAVWLGDKNFELEAKVDDPPNPPIAEVDSEGRVWVTVKLHVPALDIDAWIDGTHGDHPNNLPIEVE